MIKYYYDVYYDKREMENAEDLRKSASYVFKNEKLDKGIVKLKSKKKFIEWKITENALHAIIECVNNKPVFRWLNTD